MTTGRVSPRLQSPPIIDILLEMFHPETFDQTMSRTPLSNRECIRRTASQETKVDTVSLRPLTPVIANHQGESRREIAREIAQGTGQEVTDPGTTREITNLGIVQETVQEITGRRITGQEIDQETEQETGQKTEQETGQKTELETGLGIGLITEDPMTRKRDLSDRNAIPMDTIRPQWPLLKSLLPVPAAREARSPSEGTVTITSIPEIVLASAIASANTSMTETQALSCLNRVDTEERRLDTRMTI